MRMPVPMFRGIAYCTLIVVAILVALAAGLLIGVVVLLIQVILQPGKVLSGGAL